MGLIVTADCNLCCEYCYQGVKRPLRMSWNTARAAIDLLLRSRHPVVELRFSGGEPLLEFPTVRRAVEYAKSMCPPGKRVNFGLSTNGLLVTEEVASFLAGNRFDVQLSFDGVAGAQDVREKGTFAVLDRLLDSLRQKHPTFYRRHLTICITLVPQALRYLARSVDYFLGKRVGRISLTPTISGCEGRNGDFEDPLEVEFARIYESSHSHLQRSGGVPVLLFRKRQEPSPAASPGMASCNLIRGTDPAVDVDGRVIGCEVLAPSHPRFPSTLLRSLSEAALSGRLGDSDLEACYEELPDRARRTGIFDHGEKRYSSYGRCGDCEYRDRCGVCPVASAYIPGNVDPNRVPDFQCVFNRIALKYRDRFPAQPRPPQVGRLRSKTVP